MIVKKYLIAFLTLIFLIVGFTGCRSHKQSSKAEKAQKQSNDSLKAIPQATAPVPVNECRIAGTIIEIDSTLSTDDKSPCSRAVCNAVVKIDRVLGYGSGFTKVLAPGQTIPVHFNFTLAPSQKVLPKANVDLPGLTTGSTFVANLNLREMIGKREQFSIGKYEVIDTKSIGEMK